MGKNMKHNVNPETDDFGLILNSAVRYALGRQTYMPTITVGFITPLLPFITQNTLERFDRDLDEQAKMGELAFGSPTIDKPIWDNFHRLVQEELERRGIDGKA